MNSNKRKNRLIEAKSLYLKQHQTNPVHWQPFSPEVVAMAATENKPIFLSIGYSSCHWCHVMAHESFVDQATADYLNDNFICIKVDKEEYPDLDQYYQQASQLFVQTGGWPLSAFLMPDMKPYFVGTYFPKEKQGEGATFMELIQELRRAYHENKEEVLKNATEVDERIREGLIPKDKVEFEGHFPGPLGIIKAIEPYKDSEFGGYGEAPKFPHFPYYEWCLEQMLEGMIPQEEGQHIIDSIEGMLMGGMYDHARGGIHRYSVDKKWLVPHFEKMLYDQSGLLRVLSKTSLLYPSPMILDGLMDTLHYLEKEMKADNHYFFASQDADSEGVEGLYFTFTKEEFEDLVNRSSDTNLSLEDKIEEIKGWFQIGDTPNFERNLNVISLDPDKKNSFYTDENWPIIRKIRNSILEERKNRIPPATDNKGIASWNFMLLTSLVEVMQYVKYDQIRQKASDLLNYALEGMYNQFLQTENQVIVGMNHTNTLDKTPSFFEDYVFFTESQLRVYEITGNSQFKKNFSDAMDFLHSEFIEDGNRVLTRAKAKKETCPYPNLYLDGFDQSFKNPIATFIHMARRGRVLFKDGNKWPNVDAIMENLKHQVLKNPINGGEGLRACTYPDHVYRVIEVPRAWLTDNAFLQFIPFFLPRFVLDYQEKDEVTWQICNLNQCEMQGSGKEDFFNQLRPKNNEQ